MLYRGETTQVPPVYSVEKEKITIPKYTGVMKFEYAESK